MGVPNIYFWIAQHGTGRSSTTLVVGKNNTILHIDVPTQINELTVNQLFPKFFIWLFGRAFDNGRDQEFPQLLSLGWLAVEDSSQDQEFAHYFSIIIVSSGIDSGQDHKHYFTLGWLAATFGVMAANGIKWDCVVRRIYLSFRTGKLAGNKTSYEEALYIIVLESCLGNVWK